MCVLQPCHEKVWSRCACCSHAVRRCDPDVHAAAMPWEDVIQMCMLQPCREKVWSRCACCSHAMRCDPGVHAAAMPWEGVIQMCMLQPCHEVWSRCACCSHATQQCYSVFCDCDCLARFAVYTRVILTLSWVSSSYHRAPDEEAGTARGRCLVVFIRWILSVVSKVTGWSENSKLWLTACNWKHKTTTQNCHRLAGSVSLVFCTSLMMTRTREMGESELLPDATPLPLARYSHMGSGLNKSIVSWIGGGGQNPMTYLSRKVSPSGLETTGPD